MDPKLADFINKLTSRGGPYPWATESTLQDLLEVMTAIASKQEAISRNTADALKASQKKDKSKAYDDRREAHTRKRFESDLRKTDEALRDLKSTIMSAAVIIPGMTAGLGGNLQGLWEKFHNLYFKSSALGKGIGTLTLMVAGVVTQLKYMLDTLQAFRTMREEGVQLSGTLIDLRLDIAKSTMDMEQFTNMMISSSSALAYLNKIGRNGAEQIGVLSRNVRDAMVNVGQFGMTTDQVNAYLSDYLEQQRLISILGRLSNIEERDAARKYLEELDKFSTVMGKSRKEISEGAKEISKQPWVRAWFETLTPEMRKRIEPIWTKVNVGFNSLKESGFKLADMFAEIVSAGIPVTDETAMFVSRTGDLGQEFFRLARDVREGRLSEEEVEERFKILSKTASEFNYSLSTLKNLPEMHDLVAAMQELSKANFKFSRKTDDTTDMMSNLELAAAKLRSSFGRMVAKFFGNPKLISSLEFLAQKFIDFSNWFERTEKEGFFDSFIKSISDAASWLISSWWGFAAALVPGTALIYGLFKVVRELGNGFRWLLGGTVKHASATENVAKRAGLLTRMFRGLWDVLKWMAPTWDGLKRSLGGAWSLLKNIVFNFRAIAWKLFGIARFFGPIGLAITTLTTAVVLAIKYWDEITDFMWRLLNWIQRNSFGILGTPKTREPKPELNIPTLVIPDTKEPILIAPPDEPLPPRTKKSDVVIQKDESFEPYEEETGDINSLMRMVERTNDRLLTAISVLITSSEESRILLKNIERNQKEMLGK